MPNKDKKDLMEMITFGAEDVFKSGGSSLTDADIDAIISQGEKRTAEMKARLEESCQHTLASYNMEGGDPSKLYELDGKEYDAQGIQGLIRKLRAAEARGGGSLPSMHVASS